VELWGGEMKSILGKKLGMTRVFGEDGEVISVTIIEVGPCYITQVKTEGSDGYDALQLGFASAKRLNKPQEGHLKELPAEARHLRHLREIRTSTASEHKVGDKVLVDQFEVGDVVDVVGTSKGKGFAGGMKRHGFHGGPKTHGQSDRQRSPGSIGSSATPGRVLKGMRMAGRMGGQRVTAQNLQVVLVDPERNLLGVRGSVPGRAQGLVVVQEATKT